MSIGETLRHPVMVRLAEPSTEPVEDWCQRNKTRNDFDRGVLDYPCTKVLAGTDGNGNVFAYMPIQTAGILESIGPNPSSTPLEVAMAIVEMVRGAALLTHGGGMRELLFVSTDELTAAGAEKLGFEKLPYPVYRKRLG